MFGCENDLFPIMSFFDAAGLGWRGGQVPMRGSAWVTPELAPRVPPFGQLGSGVW